MKKLKLFVIATISILLSSCSNTPSPTDDSIVNRENQRLNNSINIPQSGENNENTIRFPASGKMISGENNQNFENDITLDETPNTITETYQKEADATSATTNKIPNNENTEKELLAYYSSKVYTKTEDRQKNLRIVCEKLSGIILNPNEEFSYNTTCGPYNKENGFGKATVFLGDGTEKQDYGGGVCQLSSTLYNAVKDLNVEITERHNHSKKVYYVPDGQDATVSYGHLDFRFKNLNEYSLLMEAKSDAQTVDVYIYKV